METDIVKKLKLVQETNILILNKPVDVIVFNSFSFDVKEKKTKYSVIIVFIFSIDQFISHLKHVIDGNLLYQEGWLYFVYPKKGNKKHNEYIGRDDFFAPSEMNEEGYVFKSKLKFNKMLAFDETFTLIGLKYIEKKKKESAKPSQRMNDYIDKVADLQQYFSKNLAVLSIYNKLAPGYQRDWARYIYSTKSEETMKKRLTKMEEILKEGYKSIDLYRVKKK